MKKKYPLIYKGKIISSGNINGLHPILLAFNDIKNGLFVYHYPFCCITQFVFETLKCEPASYKRNEEYNLYYYEKESRQYVPCNHCMKRIQRVQEKLLVKYYDQ